MTTAHVMDCRRFNDALMEHLEGDLKEPMRAAMERHAAACATCGALLADLRRLELDAARLPELAPSRDLWAGVAARIETPVVAIGGATAPAPARARWSARRWTNAALFAASLVLAVTLGYAARGARTDVAQGRRVDTASRPSAPAVPDVAALPDAPADPAAAPPAESAARITGATPVVPAARRTATTVVSALTADYDREIAKLRAIVRQRRVQLDSTTLAVIERNLAVIDSAIADSRRAIATDPASPYLIELLNQSLQTKVELLRTAALLPSRT